MIRSIVNQLGSMIIALILATAVWIVATNDENPTREAFYPNRLPIEIVDLSTDLSIYGDKPDTALIKVRAPQVSWDQFHPGSFHVVADLKELGAGVHEVSLQVQTNDSRAVVTAIDPQKLSIRLEPIKSRKMDVHSEVLDAAPPGYAFSSPVISPTLATVSGSGILVDQVNEVIADVYLRGSKVPIEREVTALPKDAQGNLVQGVTVVPATVNVQVQVEQRVGYKDVSVKTVLKGAPAPGYWVSNITVNPSSATIVGSPDAMAKVAGFVETVPIDITGVTADLSRRAVLSLPEGVSILNNEGINIQISVTPILGGQTVRRKVVVQGLARGLSASVSPDSIDVILSGPLPSLQSLLPDDVLVAVDATGMTPGTYVLKPRVTLVPDPLNVQSMVPDTVQVIVTALPSTASTPTTAPGSNATATPTSTPTR